MICALVNLPVLLLVSSFFFPNHITSFVHIVMVTILTVLETQIVRKVSLEMGKKKKEKCKQIFRISAKFSGKIVLEFYLK